MNVITIETTTPLEWPKGLGWLKLLLRLTAWYRDPLWALFLQTLISTRTRKRRKRSNRSWSNRSFLNFDGKDDTIWEKLISWGGLMLKAGADTEIKIRTRVQAGQLWIPRFAVINGCNICWRVRKNWGFVAPKAKKRLKIQKWNAKRVMEDLEDRGGWREKEKSKRELWRHVQRLWTNGTSLLQVLKIWVIQRRILDQSYLNYSLGDEGVISFRV